MLLPVGWCHGDLDALRAVQEAGGGRFTLLEDVGSPLEVGAVIGACDYFVGSSLHGNLTALAFGVPHVVVNNPLRSAKLEGYVQLAGLEDFRITDWAALEACFDRLADLISRAAEERRESKSSRPVVKPGGDIPLELYATIGTLHERLEDERAARRATERQLDTSEELMRDRNLAHSARVERLEERARHLGAEAQRLRARNQSLEKRLREIENRLREIVNSTVWRLFGPYRRLRPIVSALIKPRPDDARDAAGPR